jgi:ferrochelatase
VADCLETLEEIGLRAEEQFKAAGGERLALVPSLNASDAWVEALVGLLRRTAGVPA